MEQNVMTTFARHADDHSDALKVVDGMEMYSARPLKVHCGI